MKSIKVLILFAALSPVLGCPNATSPTPPTAPTLIPGANNQFDQDTYRALATAHGFATQAASNPSILTPGQKTLLNQFITDLNAADLLYSAYHVGLATEAAMKAELAKVKSDQDVFTAGVQ